MNQKRLFWKPKKLRPRRYERIWAFGPFPFIFSKGVLLMDSAHYINLMNQITQLHIEIKDIHTLLLIELYYELGIFEKDRVIEILKKRFGGSENV